MDPTSPSSIDSIISKKPAPTFESIGEGNVF